MPRILEHIDKIARVKQRDVLFIKFNDFKDLDFIKDQKYDYKKDQTRTDLVAWLDENEIPYEECFPIASENMMGSYQGQLYIDLVIDETDSKYELLCEHLENEDGSFKIKGIGFYLLPLKIAMKNAHHDEPGFWDKWAEEF